VLVHVVDVAHPAASKQADAVFRILEELGVSEELPMVTAWNKVDAHCDPDIVRRIADERPETVALSGASGEGVGDLLVTIEAALEEAMVQFEALVPYADGHIVNQVREEVRRSACACAAWRTERARAVRLQRHSRACCACMCLLIGARHAGRRSARKVHGAGRAAVGERRPCDCCGIAAAHHRVRAARACLPVAPGAGAARRGALAQLTGGCARNRSNTSAAQGTLAPVPQLRLWQCAWALERGAHSRSTPGASDAWRPCAMPRMLVWCATAASSGCFTPSAAAHTSHCPLARHVWSCTRSRRSASWALCACCKCLR
jgi:hypothetical protein